MASGIADDMLTTTVMATKAPVLVALAMNTNMYENPVTQKNIAYLRSIGVRFLEPIEGDLACGTVGKGHIPETDDIVRATLDAMEEQRQPKDLTGLTVAVTAGPTREPIDPVRYITNKSSGKMAMPSPGPPSFAGARVLLISGQRPWKPPPAWRWCGWRAPGTCSTPFCPRPSRPISSCRRPRPPITAWPRWLPRRSKSRMASPLCSPLRKIPTWPRP